MVKELIHDPAFLSLKAEQRRILTRHMVVTDDYDYMNLIV